MYKIKYRRNATDTEFPIDKALKKDYNERGILQQSENAFNDDALANFALDYLYADANKSKTQGFLKNNGFPSAQDRRLNKALYGEQEERSHMLGMLKDKTNSILNPKLPNETDRAFLRGLMGEKEGEQDYQKQITDANRALQDLQDAFRGTELERGLKPAVPIRNDSPGIKYVTGDNQNATDKIERVAVLNSTQEYDLAQQPDKPMPPSGLQNRDYGDKGFWYIPGTDNSNPPSNPSPPSKPTLPSNPSPPSNPTIPSNPTLPNNSTPPNNPNTTNNSEVTNNAGNTNISENKINTSEPKPKAVRANVENAGGSVKWNPENNTATIKINGYTEDFHVGDGYGTFIQDGVMYTDALHLDNLIHAPTQTQVKNIYDEITDDFGKFVVRKWFYGDGSDVNVSGERWNAFIKNNSKVQEKFEKTVQQAISAGNSTFDIKKSVALSEDGDGGYASGYELINGSNKTVGDFALRGNISSMGNGKYFVTIEYVFNDIIDPNNTYFKDWYYSLAADLLGVTGKDYTLRISGTANFTYSAKEGIVYA